ncbi:putative membrane protein insertion efficiency factor [Agromyces hippuratus]|uniref:Putative membrane protein insertion efficiency factor n=1 Tax=Agromyces hippuratus TaxID=286438 RepID=A0A852X2N9_9MICO|nr:membrane protein insertion efficiency factor YidD [Agromyces hippuratus]NYG21714.1 putative membrane protein insertion efficiency factor [Agromyces hippuratus]
MKNAVLFAALIPRNAGVLLIRGYRAAISPLYGDVCRYYPSCSAYGLGSVQQRGLIVGSALTAWRILRCNPWSAGGIDDVRAAKHSRYRITRFGWVIPAGWSDAAASAELGATGHAHDHAPGSAGHGAPVDADVDSRAAAASAPEPRRADAALALSSSTVFRKD